MPTTLPSRPRGHRRQYRRWLWSGAVALAALVAGTLIWFQPQRLLYDQRVDEPLSTAQPQQTQGLAATPADDEAEPMELTSGRFISREHGTHGTARVLRLADGREVVRFEGFATSNGPVLVVWLSKNPADGPGGAFADAYVDLGPLKGNVGDQNYPVPTGVDAASYTSVVVWCARFHVPFGAADLAPAPER
jgi:Electron transfer DM13